MQKVIRYSKILKGLKSACEKLVTTNHQFYAIGLISQGIEFLGAIIDDKPVHEEGRSRERYDKAVREYLPEKYHSFLGKDNDIDLYKALRCGPTHGFYPGSTIELTTEKEALNTDTIHLDHNKRGRLSIIVESYMIDFLTACDEMIKKFENGKIEDKAHLHVFDD